jgi:hypothetical protein
MSLYITFIQPTYVPDNLKEQEVLAQMAKVYTDSHPVSDTTVMAQLCKNMCARHQQKIKGIIFASHGTPSSFYIGRDWITNDLLGGDVHPKKRHIIPALESLKPYFAPSAWVRIQACECGANPVFIRRLSLTMGVTVLAWTEPLYVDLEGTPTGMTGGGSEIVCNNQMCHAF